MKKDYTNIKCYISGNIKHTPPKCPEKKTKEESGKFQAKTEQFTTTTT